MRSESDETSENYVAELDAWVVFRTRLAAYISTMLGPVGSEFLELHVPMGGERTDSIRVSVVEDFVGVRIEQLWDPWADRCFAIDDAFEAAGFIADAVRATGCIPDPGLMSVTATGHAKTGVGILGLVDHASIPVEDEHLTPNPQPDVSDRSRKVLAHVREHFDQDAHFDEDGDIFLDISGARLWLQPDPDQPVVHMNASVVQGVRAKRQADLELNLLNRRLMWIRWLRYDSHIIERCDVPIEPFNPALLTDMIRNFIDNQRDVRHDLADRVNGKVVS